MASTDFQVVAKSASALFTLKLHRGDGMALLAMNWKAAQPPRDFVGFAIEYKEPNGDRYWALKNRINFPKPDGNVDPVKKSSRLAPIPRLRVRKRWMSAAASSAGPSSPSWK